MHFNLGGIEMEVCKKWTVQMKNNISGGAVIPPVLDPFDPSVFYVSDGWYSYYSSIRLRKLSVETGEELTNVLARDCVRCIHVEEDRLFAVLNKRILELDRNDLHVLRTYKKGAYADYVGFDGRDKLLLMNRNGNFLNIFDLQSETVRKKKAAACFGIWRGDENTFLILDGSGVLEYEPAANKLKRLIDTPPYIDCARGALGQLYLLEGEGEASSRLLLYPSVLGGTPQELPLGQPVRGFKLSSDETRAFLFQKDRVLVYSIPEKRVTAQHIFEHESSLLDGDYILNDRTILTYQREGNELTCWKITE